MAAYDVIIVGAGSAGAALAARLSEDPERSVILLEAGPDYVDLESMPSDLTDGTMASVDPHDWHWEGNPVAGRSVPYPRGKVTGGSSAVNGIVAIRGVPEDYDEWAALGNEGWGWEDCLPALRRLEDDQDHGGDLHGNAGPIPIVRWRDDELTPLQASFQEACLAAGHPASNDHNVPGATGVGSWAMNRTGTLRISTAIGYLNPARDRLNLTIRAGCEVNRVLVEDGAAVGVEVQHDGRMQTVRGAQIVLCAGALHSPPILLRSGIGPAAQLAEVGVDLVHDLPGVGQNLRDHPSVTLISQPKDGVISPGDPLQQIGLRYTASDSDEENDMQMYMWSYEAERVAQVRINLPRFDHLFMITPTLQRPKSIGNLRLASPDLETQPLIDINLLDDESDVERMVDGVRRAWDLLHSETIADKTEIILRPSQEVVEDDEAIREFLQDNVSHLVHPVGTCKMGPAADPLAVVDDRCRVHGIDNLRVADASIMPNIVRGNTNLTSIMIGERLAEFMGAE